MKTLIIYAHPDTGGHCAEILNNVIASLKEIETDIVLLNLYKMKYDPLLHEKEHYTRGNYTISKQNKEIQKQITNADKLIFIYPVWWNSMPAIMKGFIDRVFTSKFAFEFVNGYPKGLLKGRKAAVFITSGANNFMSCLFMGKRAAKIMKKDILQYCGIKTKVFQYGGALNFDDSSKQKIEKLVKKGLSWLY
ncbi:NAD(P)H-dependent oxidoreductase [Candidatus Woesearchaeota archaeon]|jgi:NAD(P)H dehydrogenase (quinone)|nr:NAD(P)H-dependent oxidoreductase [Candidatus Woesearchaeota archaeon]